MVVVFTGEYRQKTIETGRWDSVKADQDHLIKVEIIIP